MKVDIVMPKLGESITEGTIIKWWKKPGELVKKDETLLEISTDKVDSEIPSPYEGILLEILKNENDTVEVDKVIARMETEVAEAVAEEVKEPAKMKSAGETEEKAVKEEVIPEPELEMPPVPPPDKLRVAPRGGDGNIV
ncbi:MAG: biotin/lipoyl-containing protein, partial [Calditrichia bacterium]